MSTIENPLVSLTSQWNEIVKRIGNGSISPESAKNALQDIIEGNLVQPVDPFQHLLSSLAEQKRQLIEFGGLSEEHFEGVDMNEPAEQRVDQYTTLFWVPDGTYEEGDPASTLEFYMSFMESKSLVVYRGFKSSEVELRLQQRCLRHENGLHRVVVDLTANWDKKNGRSMRQVFASDGPSLAGVEALAAYALSDPRLIQSQDGEKLPYCDTGIKRWFDDSCTNAVYFYQISDNRGVGVGSDVIDGVGRDSAMPSVSRES